MPDIATFIVEFPAFATADAALRTAKLADAVIEIPATYGSDYDRAVYLHMAAALYEEPFGMDIAIQRADAVNPYRARLEVIRRRKGNCAR